MHIAFLTFAIFAAASPAAAASKPVTAFVGVDVVAMTGNQVFRDQTVVVEEGRITAIDARVKTKVPRGARKIDGKGKYLIPGLAEMHGHIPPPQAPAEVTSDVLFLYLAHGITTVRGMLGAPGQLELREKAARGEIDSPNLYLAGPSFNGNSITSPEEAAEKVRQQKKEGWDLLKVHPGLTLSEYEAMAKAAKEEAIRFGGHVPEEVGLLRALEAGQETFDHLDGYIEYLGGYESKIDPAKMKSVLDLTKAANAWVVPTMALWEVLFGTVPLEELLTYAELRYATKSQVDSWKNAYETRRKSPQFDLKVSKRVIGNRNALLGAMNKAGVKILMGTDAPQQFSIPGFSLHRELQRMSAAGMTPYEILVTGTSNVGEYFKESDSFGTIEKGKRADLILLDADPLARISNLTKIRGVMVRGKWYSRETIDARLAKIDEKS